MAQLSALVQGTVVSSYVKSYESFSTPEGSTMPGGSYSVVWVAQAPNRAPLEIRKWPEPLPTQGDIVACMAVQVGKNVRWDGPANVLPTPAPAGKS